ncbi:heterochromatin protein [Aspergillus sp. HF37]|nr:heterochromatin protein [Aspergillus sp. HF37]
MPPPVEDVSDDESTGGSIPYDNNDGQGDATDQQANDGSDEEEVFVVEKIIGHDFGKLYLQVKWKGYNDPKDLTMEPEENLIEGAKEVVDEYYRAQGGRPEKPTKKRKSQTETKPAAGDAESTKRRKSKGATGTETPEGEELADWVPKGKNWENDIASVETVSREPSGELSAFLIWNNRKKSKVSIETCHRKCPMKASSRSLRVCNRGTDLHLDA